MPMPSAMHRARQSPDSDPPAKLAELMHLRELPRAQDFPILLAARMSLSFPLLFAAVPLWAIDYGWPRGQRTFRRCMFADGGISSNFPIHLFDGLLPLWPTFGIELEAKLPGYDNMIYLPQSCRDGFADTLEPLRYRRQIRKPPGRIPGKHRHDHAELE